MIGKNIRLERIIDRGTHRTIVVPMDHGVTVGPIHGLVDYSRTVDEVAEGGANAVLMHKGLVRAGHRGGGRDIGLIIHVSASTKLGPDPNAKVHVCTVEEALKLGADAVSVHVNLGAATEPHMIEGMGRLSDSCLEWGMPLLAMMYCRGSKIENEYDPKHVAQAARVGAELGADIVKVNYTGSPESFREVVSGCPVPVIIAGGEKVESDEDVLAVVAGALDAGCAGVSIGRNVFQHDDPRLMVKAIASLVHGGHPLDEARAILRGRA